MKIDTLTYQFQDRAGNCHSQHESENDQSVLYSPDQWIWNTQISTELMSVCEWYPGTKLKTYFVVPISLWVTTYSTVIACKFSRFQVCWKVSQRALSCQTRWGKWCRFHWLKVGVNDVIKVSTFTARVLHLMGDCIYLTWGGAVLCCTHILSLWSWALLTTHPSKITPVCDRGSRGLLQKYRWHIPVGVRRCNHQEPRDWLTRVFCRRSQHMLVLTECLHNYLWSKVVHRWTETITLHWIQMRGKRFTTSVKCKIALHVLIW